MISLIFFNSPDYNVKIHNQGQVEETGNDIVIYYQNGMVKAHLRNYINMYVNRYFDLYVKGKSENEELTLKGICFEERSIFERSFFKLNFNSDSLKIDRRTNFTLVRKNEIISGLKWLGNMPKYN